MENTFDLMKYIFIIYCVFRVFSIVTSLPIIMLFSYLGYVTVYNYKDSYIYEIKRHYGLEQ